VATGTALPFPLWRRDSGLLASQSAQRNNSERLNWFQDGPERLVSLASLVVRNRPAWACRCCALGVFHNHWAQMGLLTAVVIVLIVIAAHYVW
jgi:hypothetical protein